MADYASSLPIRTETDGDVVMELKSGAGVDIATVNASKELLVKDTDAATALTAANASLDAIEATNAAIDTSLNNIEADADAIATSVAAIDTQQTDGTQKTQVVDGAGDVLAVNTDGSINVVVQNAAVSSTEKHVYGTSAAVAPATPTNVINYTVTAGKTFLLKQIQASNSGRSKVEVKTGPSGSEVSKGVWFGSTSDANVMCEFARAIEVVAGDKILVIVTNRDLVASDLYAFINGDEV